MTVLDPRFRTALSWTENGKGFGKGFQQSSGMNVSPGSAPMADAKATSKESETEASMGGSDLMPNEGIRRLTRKFLKESLGNRVVTGAAGIFASRIAFNGLSFILSVILARMLGVSGFGVYTYSFAWVVLLTVPGMLGMDQLLVREIAASTTQAGWGSIRNILRKANEVVLLASLTLVITAGLVSWLLIHRTDPQLRETFLVALLLLPLITLTRVRQCALQGLHRVVLGVLPEMVIQPIFLIASLLGFAFWLGRGHLTPPRAMGLNVMSCLVAFLIGAGFLLKSLPRTVMTISREQRAWNWRKSALPLMFLASAGVIYGQADTLMLGAIRGAKAVGIYGIADRGSELIIILLNVVSTALAPQVASMYAAGDMQGLQRVVIRFARLTLLFSLPLAIAMMGFGYWYISFFYGFAFTPGNPALIILSVGKVLSVVMGVPGMILIMTGYELDAAYGIGVSAVITILLNLVLIPKWGLEGTAISSASTVVLWNVWMTILVHKRLGIYSTALGRFSLRKAVGS